MLLAHRCGRFSAKQRLNRCHHKSPDNPALQLTHGFVA
ncbi:hypothetical protein YPPY45_0639, partial [Yersinia pestis PY-45]